HPHGPGQVDIDNARELRWVVLLKQSENAGGVDQHAHGIKVRGKCRDCCSVGHVQHVHAFCRCAVDADGSIACPTKCREQRAADATCGARNECSGGKSVRIGPEHSWLDHL